jgi:hypothetical protein
MLLFGLTHLASHHGRLATPPGTQVTRHPRDVLLGAPEACFQAFLRNDGLKGVLNGNEERTQKRFTNHTQRFFISILCDTCSCRSWGCHTPPWRKSQSWGRSPLHRTCTGLSTGRPPSCSCCVTCASAMVWVRNAEPAETDGFILIHSS